MADIVINKIENSAKVEALIGVGITGLITLLAQKIYAGEEVPIEVFWGLTILGSFFVAIQLLYYLKFYIEKMVYFREQEVMATVQTVTLDREITKLGLMKDIAVIEARA